MLLKVINNICFGSATTFGIYYQILLFLIQPTPNLKVLNDLWERGAYHMGDDASSMEPRLYQQIQVASYRNVDYMGWPQISLTPRSGKRYRQDATMLQRKAIADGNPRIERGEIW